MTDASASAPPPTPIRKPTKILQPVVIIDTREQRPLEISGYPVERGTLPVGDYGIKGFSDWTNPAFIVERKSLQDLYNSLIQGRERFFKEINKLRQFQFRALLIEAHRFEIESGAFHGGASPASLLASLDAIQVRVGLHINWAGDSIGAAIQLEGLVRQFIRGIEKDYDRLHKYV